MSEENLLTSFKAHFRGGKFDRKGELSIDLVIPKEEKDKAMALTDVGDLLFEFRVYMRTPELDIDELLEGFVMPEGAILGDGKGGKWNRAGLSESKNLHEGKIANQRNKK